MNKSLLFLPLLALLLSACAGGQPHQKTTQDPDAPLRPGLVQLHPYRFHKESLTGLKWLENYVASHPISPEGTRARYWILKTRLDWLTHVYLLENPDERIDGFLALADHLHLEHTGALNENLLFQTLETLEVQAKALGQKEGYQKTSTDAVEYLTMLRHLDQNKDYFQQVQKIAQSLRGEEKEHNTFAANALLVALLDLSRNLRDLSEVDPPQYTHALARIAAYPCPEGFLSFAGSNVEKRFEAVASCQITCTKSDACNPSGAKIPTPHFSVDNEVVYQSAHSIHQLLNFLDKAQKEGRSPLLELHRDRSLALQASIAARAFVLGPSWDRNSHKGAGVDLPRVNYAEYPTPAPALFVIRGEETRISAQPLLSIEVGKAEPSTHVSSHPFPGTRISALSTEKTQKKLAETMHQLMRELEKNLQGPENTLTPGTSYPSVALGRDELFSRIQPLASVLRQLQFAKMGLLVGDHAQERAGLLMLGLQKKPDNAPVLTLGADAWSLQSEDAPKKVWKISPGAPLPLGDLYRAIFPISQKGFLPIVPYLGVKISPETRYGDVIKVMDLLRVRRQVGDLKGEAAGNAPPEAASGAMTSLVREFVLMP